MGSSIAAFERRVSFRESTRNTGQADSLRMDEKRAYLGSADPSDCREPNSSQAVVFARQLALLVRLIGGEAGAAERLSARLLTAFGSIGGVLSARPAALSRVIEDQELVRRLAAARSAVLEALSEDVHRTRFELANAMLQRWIVGLFTGLRRERIHMALLDDDKRLIFDEPLADGDLQCVAGNLRKIVGSGLEVEASGVVLMHNHPSGNVNPSAGDVKATRKIAFLLENLDLRLEDHLIVSGNAIFSMRKACLI